MKDIKCPTCKGELKQFNVLRDGTLVEVGCHKCKWSTHPNSPVEAWKEVEEFISLFPPIMRLEVGDKLHFLKSYGRQHYATVEEGVLSDGWILTDKGACRTDEVLKWPWELEQEGGQ